jgi:hypothetical protein
MAVMRPGRARGTAGRVTAPVSAAYADLTLDGDDWIAIELLRLVTA